MQPDGSQEPDDWKMESLAFLRSISELQDNIIPFK